MLRLASRIAATRAGTFHNDPEPGHDAWQQKIAEDDIKRIRAECPCIIADNIYEYLQHEAESGSDFIPLNTFSCLRPPFVHTWIEYTCRFDDETHQCGAMVRSCERSAEMPPDLFEEFPSTERELRISVWGQKKGIPHFASTTATVLLDAGGAYLATWVHSTGPFKDDTGAVAALYPFLVSLQFLNFPNVVRYDATETEGPSRKWIRRMKQPTLRYQILNINPHQEVTRRPRSSGDAVAFSEKALHWVRGHMVTYSKEKPLFGKYPGTFWIPEHTRGDEKNGVIKSDYRLNVSPALAGVPFSQPAQKT